MPRPLAVGIQLPEVERAVTWRELRSMARTAEQVGFDSLWVGDHLLYRTADGAKGPWEAWSQLAALGEATERILLGPLVAATSFHNPAMLAKKAATVDEISGGRLILGLGAGWNRDEYDAFGFPFDRRASRFEEAFTIIRTLLTDGAIDFEGEFYTLRECELLPPAREGVPLMVGSEGPRVLAATLPHVDMWNGWHDWYGNTPSGARELIEKVDAVAVASGRDPSTLQHTVAVLVHAPGAVGSDNENPARRSTIPLAGDPGDIAAGIASFTEVGVGHVQLVVDPITEASIEWLGSVLEILDRM